VIVVTMHDQPAQRRGLLLGLYEGVPLTEWGWDYNGRIPDKITLYKNSIEQVASSPEELPHIIRETLLHEIAHHLGFDHPHIRGMEKKWRGKRGKAA
jgi:predicted Zn-dependent protease with MMP-like domain